MLAPSRYVRARVKARWAESDFAALQAESEGSRTEEETTRRRGSALLLSPGSESQRVVIKDKTLPPVPARRPFYVHQN